MYGPVEQGLYQSFVSELGEPFAFSYLMMAAQSGNRLKPYTMVAHDKLSQTWAAQQILKRHGVQLVETEPYSKDRVWP